MLHLRNKLRAMIDKNTIQLLRLPFSILLMPVFVLALSQINTAFTFWDALIPFIIIHVLIYPASNGYNSYMDKDEQSIGGLEKPPMPTIVLFYVTLALDIIALICAYFFVSSGFALCLFICILASRAYSARQIRLKKYAILSFLLVAFFQGAFTFYMSYLGISKTLLDINDTTLWILAACSFQIAGVYPMTQIYQHHQDLADGVTTISYKLGYKGTFIFSTLMFGLCNMCYFLYFNKINQINNFYIIQLFFIPIVSFFVYWFLKVLKNTDNANFKNTMLLNLIAAICMNLCFIVLILIK
jgi:4-hydroxybenzoate polyprenyltransferase